MFLKKQLRANLLEPKKWGDFYNNFSKVMFKIWLDRCPKEVRSSAINRAEEILEESDRGK